MTQPNVALKPVICVQNINHYYGAGELRRQILFDISLDIQPGEIVILTGPSGSGKTTLLTLMGGLRSVQEGSLTILGQELNRASDRKLEQVRQKIGFIFQAHNLLTSLTASENVQMAAVLHQNASMTEVVRKSHEVLDSVGLGHRIHAYPDRLSGGQKQRVAIARALINQPKIILADEPTAALDKTTGRSVVELMQHLAKQQGCAIVLVTHDNRILDIADRIISLEDGRLSSSKGKLLLDISNLVSAIAGTTADEIKALIDPLSIEQFSEFLNQLNTEFGQILTAMNLLNDHSLSNKLNLTIRSISLKIAQILDAEQVTFFVVDPESQRLWSKNAIGPGRQPIALDIPLGAGIAGHVVKTGESVNIPDPYNDDRFNPQIDRDTGFRTRNLICLPIFNSQNQLFAVVQALNKTGDSPFSAEDEKKFFDLTQSLGVILETSILYMQESRHKQLPIPGVTKLLKRKDSTKELPLDLPKKQPETK